MRQRHTKEAPSFLSFMRWPLCAFSQRTTSLHGTATWKEGTMRGPLSLRCRWYTMVGICWPRTSERVCRLLRYCSATRSRNADMHTHGDDDMNEGKRVSSAGFAHPSMWAPLSLLTAHPHSRPSTPLFLVAASGQWHCAPSRERNTA